MAPTSYFPNSAHFAHAIAACGLALASCGGGQQESAAPSTVPERSNVLLIVVDTLRADHLSCYGHGRETSPAIDELANSGVRFERAYASAPWTIPSVASILTGLQPSTHGMKTVRDLLPEEATTLAEVLASQGYATAGVISHGLLRKRYNFHQGFDSYDEREAQNHRHISSENVTSHARALLEQSAAGEQPFFLFVHYFDPHYQYMRHPGIGFAAASAGRLNGSEPFHQMQEMGTEMTTEEVQLLRDLYDEEIRFTDKAIGDLLGSLDELGLAKDTIVILTADHGEGFLEHDWLGHTKILYDEVVRVPLIVRVPGTPAPRSVPEPVSLVSIMPTVLDLVGISRSTIPAQGPSLAGLLRDGEAAPAKRVLIEVDFDANQRRYAGKNAHKKSLAGPRWKLILDEMSGALELYDMTADPGEKVNLASTEQAVVERLSLELEERLSAAHELELAVKQGKLSDEDLKHLRELGYLGR